VGDAIPKDAIHVPALCQKHNSAVVSRLRIPESGPWQAAIAINQVFLFQAATENPIVWQRCGQTDEGRETKDLSLVLAEIGCLACFLPEKFERVIGLIKRKGLNEAARISRIPPPDRKGIERI
jgi:hypothetical protein